MREPSAHAVRTPLRADLPASLAKLRLQGPDAPLVGDLHVGGLLSLVVLPSQDLLAGQARCARGEQVEEVAFSRAPRGGGACEIAALARALALPRALPRALAVAMPSTL